MDNQMNALQTQIDGITNRNLALRDELETVETVMSRVMRERDQALQRSKKLQGELSEARQRIADLHSIQQQAMQRGFPIKFRCGWITLGVESELDSVGLTAAFSRALADQSISCNVVAGTYHDHLFVPLDRADAALECLRELQTGDNE